MLRYLRLLLMVPVLAVAGAAFFNLSQQAAAQDAATAATAPATEIDNSFVGIILAGGWVGHTIILLSVVAMALAIDHLWKIRATTLMPPGLAEGVQQLLLAGQPVQAVELCRARPSVLANVMQAGLMELDGGWPAVEKAMEDAVVEESARLYRRIEYLSVIGNIAPMLGLLGTVIGMVVAFREVAITQGAARAADLAGGIYLALVTTVEGLVVAIPALGAFAIFRNRVDQFVAEVAFAAQHAFAPLRHGRAARPRAAGGGAPTAPPVAGRP